MLEPITTAARRFAGALVSLAALLAIAPAASALSFSNPGRLTINDASASGTPAQSTPYPSSLAVSATGAVTKATVTLHGFAHSCPSDVDMLLVGPHGQESILMSDAGDCTENARAPIELSFDDSGPAMPCYSDGVTTLGSGTYAPTDEQPVTNCNNAAAPDVFDPPAPPGPWPVGLGAFNGVDPQGTWQLYTMDQNHDDSGSIAGGWTLDLTIAAATLGGPPSIAGRPVVGNVLAAASGPIGNGGAPTYSWSRCNARGKGCRPIAGASAATHTVAGADTGHRLAVTETAVTSGGASGPLASKPTAAVRPALATSSTKRAQRVLAQRGVIVSLVSNVRGRLVATGTISVRKGRVVRLRTVRKALAPGRRVKLKLGISAAALRSLKGARLKAKITLTVTAAGTRSTQRLAIKLSA